MMGFDQGMYAPPKGSGFPPSPPSPVLRGKTIFVSSVGSSGGARQDVAYHFSTIQEAINVFQEGDVIAVYPGTYEEDLSISQDQSVHIFCMPGVILSPASERIVELSNTDSSFLLFGSANIVIPDGLYGFINTIISNSLHLEFYNGYVGDSAYLAAITVGRITIKCNDVFINAKGTPFSFGAVNSGESTLAYLDFNFIGNNTNTPADVALVTASCIDIFSRDSASVFIIKGKHLARNAIGPMISVNNNADSSLIFLGSLSIDIDQVNVDYSGSTRWNNGLDVYSCFLWLNNYMTDEGVIDVKANVYAINSCNGIVSRFFNSTAESTIEGKGFTFTGIIKSTDEAAAKVYGNFLAQCHFHGLFISNNTTGVFILGDYSETDDPYSLNTPVVIEGQIRQYGTGDGITINANEDTPANSIKPILKNLTIWKQQTGSGSSVRSPGALIDIYVYQAVANVASSGVNELVDSINVDSNVI